MSIDRLILGTRKGLLILDRNDNWRIGHESFSGSHVSYVFLDERSGNLFACLDDGHFGNKLFRWSGFLTAENWRDSNSKEVWQELSAPKYPEGSKLSNGNDAVLKYQWAMASGASNQPGRIYLGTEPGGLFVSEDHGDTFELCQPLWDHPSRTEEGGGWFGGGRDNPGIHSVCIDPRDPDHVRIGISCAGVFATLDAGQTWRPTNKGLKAEFLPNPDSEIGQDPHLLVQCLEQPDIMWQQNHCGVFFSQDTGQTWRDVSDPENEANFGFAVAVDPTDGMTAWVVPAESDMVRSAVNRQMCVCRTEDGGNTWTSFRQGLPQTDCFDFAFRHCLVYQDDQLAFGTACGSLYLSENRGESWDCLNQHLPPVYCLATA